MNSELPESSERGRPRPPAGDDTLAGARTPSSALPGRGRPRPRLSSERPGAFLSSSLASYLDEYWSARGYLPHFDRERIIQFVTFRLADSLPAEVVLRLKTMDSKDIVARWRETETSLDSGYGSRILGDPTCAEIVLERLLYGHGKDYDIHAWCVMPNHVHILVHVYENRTLASVVQAWKSVSARAIAKLRPGSSPTLWQSDYFDRFIRDAEHYLKTMDYIHMNPVKAGLVEKAGDWLWSSAADGVAACENESDLKDRRGRGRPRSGNADEGVRAPALISRLAAALDSRAALSLERTLSPRPPAPAYANLADNDYLGLSRDPAVTGAGKAALEKWGASSSASPSVSGYTEEHAALENELAAWCGFEHGLVWNTGFAANAAVLGALPKRGDLVFADRLIHASMISGILSSGARLVRYPHLDLEKLRELLEKHRGHDGVVWVVTESVFSMDGDYPDLKKLVSLKNEYDFALVVDEAHATGWFGATGAGLVEREGVAGDVDILVGTLGKGLGGFGAYTLFHDELFRRYLTNFAGEFVYSTYLPPASAACARAAIRRVREIHAGGFDFAALSRRWREAIRSVVPETPDGDSSVIPVPVGDAARAMEISRRLLDAGWRVGAIRPPTVPAGESRLRVSLRTGLDENAPASFAGALADAMR